MLFSKKAPLKALFLAAAAFITLSAAALPLFAASPLGAEAACGIDGALSCPFSSEGAHLEASQAYFQPAHGPPAPSFYDPFCGPYASSICGTFQGKSCRSFVQGHHHGWLSGCVALGYGVFSFCAQIPSAPFPIFQPQCGPRGAHCVCSFQGMDAYGNFWTYYEQGALL